MIESVGADRPEYLFGPFRLDPSRELLTSGSKTIPLPGRLFALLYSLIKADGNVVPRRQLSLLLWPEGNMPESNLSQHIYLLRRILGESARDRQFIMTVHGRGFRFAAAVTLVSGVNSLRAVANDGVSSAGTDDNPLRSGYDAFAFFSRASVLLERPTAVALSTAIESLNSALAIDSHFAPALVGIAHAYVLLAQNAYAAGDRVFPRAHDAIERALALAPLSASAHAVNANVALQAHWDWDAAKRSMDTAMSLNGSSIMVRENAVWLYACAGDRTRALAELQHALALAPYSPGLQLLLGRLFILEREYERAIEHSSNLLDADPSFALARKCRAEAYILCGRAQEALVDLLFMQRDPAEDVASRLPLLCCAYAAAGDDRLATETYERLTVAARGAFVARSNLALCAIGLERHDEALGHLEDALAAREPSLLLLHASPWFARAAACGQLKRALESIRLGAQ